jgi:hypothetical protein
MNSMNERRTRNTMKLLAWLQTFSPEMYASVIEKVGEAPSAGGLSALSAGWDMLYPSNYYSGTGYRSGRYTAGLGQNGVPDDTTNVGTADDNWWKDAIDGIKQAGIAYLQYDAQKDIIAMQTERIKQGKEPISTEVVAPTVRHVVDIPADMRREMTLMGQGVMTWVMIAGAGLLGYMLLKR